TLTDYDYSRESTPVAHDNDSPLDAATLARLLNPPDRASRDEARILAAHLLREDARMMTRSRYREHFDRDRSRVLLAGRSVSTNNPLKTPLTSEEEAEVLELLIISRRSGLFGKEATGAKGYSSTVDAQGETVDASSPSGPLCVVCQFQARS